MPPAGFEPTIPASEQPQTHAFDRAVMGPGFEFKRILMKHFAIDKRGSLEDFVP